MKLNPICDENLANLRIEGIVNLINSVIKFLIILGRIDIHDIEAFYT